jgi:FkbM family methyltransferase
VNYYSQHGEDFLLDQLFKEKKRGFFVEVGCIDGKHFSNTLTFEEREWKGMCVEAHADYIEILRQNRPNSIVCHCAVGESDEDEVPFYANVRGSLSTLDGSRESHFREKFSEYFSGFEVQKVSKRRLDTLFREHNVQEVDILSLDIEGYEVEALEGLDFQRYKPLVLVVESDNSKHEQKLDEILIPNGYTKSVRVAQNIFYLLDPKLEDRIKNKSFRVTLTHTRHPLDAGEDKLIEVEIDTRTSNAESSRHLLRKIVSKVGREVRKWIPMIQRSNPRAGENFAFVYSTGRCGTLHLAKVFGDDQSYVCHEEEYKSTHLVMEEFLRPIAWSNDKEIAIKYVREKKIPYMLRKLRSVGAVNYLDTGHQIIFGLVPALLEQLEGRIKFIRLRRDRLQTALSFITAPEYNDPWMPHWEGRETIGKEHPRWALRPTDKVVHLRPTDKVWKRLNRFQRYLWYVDEVERQWQVFLADFSFPYVEVRLDELNDKEYEKLSEFLGIGYNKDLISIRHHSTEEQPNRHKPSYTEEELEKFSKEYEQLTQESHKTSKRWAEFVDG